MSASPYSIGSEVLPGLAKLTEECGEVLQIIGKVLATGGLGEHWDGMGSLEDRLFDEIADLRAAIEFFEETSPHDSAFWARHDERVRAKVRLFWQWHRKQADQS